MLVLTVKCFRFAFGYATTPGQLGTFVAPFLTQGYQTYGQAATGTASIGNYDYSYFEPAPSSVDWDYVDSPYPCSGGLVSTSINQLPSTVNNVVYGVVPASTLGIAAPTPPLNCTQIMCEQTTHSNPDPSP